MTEAELHDAVDGLSAYDSGCTDSGIKDELLRAKVIEHALGMTTPERRATWARLARRSVSDEGIEQGYGIEDVRGLADWLDEQGILL